MLLGLVWFSVLVDFGCECVVFVVDVFLVDYLGVMVDLYFGDGYVDFVG